MDKRKSSECQFHAPVMTSTATRGRLTLKCNYGCNKLLTTCHSLCFRYERFMVLHYLVSACFHLH